MKPPPAALVPLLTTAAGLRAGGASWDAVAKQVGRSAETCRRWPAAYPRDWARLLHAAGRELLADAGAEAVLVLRQLLRSDDDKVKRDAARLLLSLRHDVPEDEEPAGEETGRLAAFVEGLPDDEVARLLAELRPADRPGAGGPPPAPHGGGGPTRPE